MKFFFVSKNNIVPRCDLQPSRMGQPWSQSTVMQSAFESQKLQQINNPVAKMPM